MDRAISSPVFSIIITFETESVHTTLCHCFEWNAKINDWKISLALLDPYSAEFVLYKPWRPKVFPIWNHHIKCFSQLFLVHLNNYAMGLRPLYSFTLFNGLEHRTYTTSITGVQHSQDTNRMSQHEPSRSHKIMLYKNKIFLCQDIYIFNETVKCRIKYCFVQCICSVVLIKYPKITIKRKLPWSTDDLNVFWEYTVKQCLTP